MFPSPKLNYGEHRTALTAMVKVRPKCILFVYVMGTFSLRNDHRIPTIRVGG
uniref:Uncharacterized protein n=1 Tax=Lepeophtheirus salmonis TaxID=72036 RepID=A0A0K2TJE9_LEPSM